MKRRRGQFPIYRTRKRGRGRRGYFVVGRRRTTASAKASRALRLIRKFKRDEEVKSASDGTKTFQINIGGNWNGEGIGPYLVTGTTSATRIGKKITVKSVALRILIKLSALEAIGTAVRLVVLLDRRPAGQDVVTGTLFANNNQVNSMYKRDRENRGRFQFIHDKTYTFGSTNTTKAIKIFYNKEYDVLYELNNGNVGDVQKNNLLIFAMAETAVAAINIDYGYRFRWTDA